MDKDRGIIEWQVPQPLLHNLRLNCSPDFTIYLTLSDWRCLAKEGYDNDSEVCIA